VGGAFVIGLAGTILVTGIAPVMVTPLGAASVPVTIFITIHRLAALPHSGRAAAMMPERTGGSPLTPIRVPRALAQRRQALNGITAWMYWLGWFPVAPLNMILASFYLANRFGLDTSHTFTPVNTPIAYWTPGHLDRGDPAVLHSPRTAASASAHVRHGPRAALDDPADLHRGRLDLPPGGRELVELSGFRRLDGSGFFADFKGYGWCRPTWPIRSCSPGT